MLLLFLSLILVLDNNIIVKSCSSLRCFFPQALRSHLEGLSQPLHLRAVERTGVGPEGGQLCGGRGLSQTYD